MASRFWVGGGSANTWAATGSTNWSATSGGAGNASVPGTGDVAVFDSNSGTGNSVIGASIAIQSLECDGSSLGTGAYAGTLTHNTGVTLTLNTGQANTLRFASGMTYTPASTSSLITLTHTSGTANIKSYGKSLAALTINGVGGTTQTLDALNINAVASSTLTLTNGIFDCNGGSGGPFALTVCVVAASNSNIRSLILGGTVTIGGNVANNGIIWTVQTTTNLTFTKNSANIVVLAPTSAIDNCQVFLGGLTYNNWTLNANTNQTIFSVQDVTSVTFAALTVNSGWDVRPTAATWTVSSLTMTGTANNPVSLISSNIASVATISCPTTPCTMTWGVMQGITGSGGATFTATNTLALGRITGWSISPPADATVIAPTAAQIATAVWQDTTAGDFITSGSVGKSVMNGVALGTGLTVNDITTKTGYSISGTTTTLDALSTHGDSTWSTATGFATPTNITAGTITTVTNLTNAPTNGDLTATMKSSVTAAVPTVVAIQSGLATPTNITAGTITTVTNLTNAPTNGDLTSTMKSSVTTAASAATPTVTAGTVSDKTGYALTSAYDAAKTAAQAGDAMTVSGTVNANITKVNSITVNGNGSSGTPWGP